MTVSFEIIRLHREAERFPKEPKRWLRLGLTLMRQLESGESEDVRSDSFAAHAALRHALALKPKKAAELWVLSESLEQLGDSEGALEAAMAGAYLAPNDFRCLGKASELLVAQGDVERASNCLTQLVKAYPNHAEWRYLWARVLVARGEYQMAAREAEQVVRLNPSMLDGWRALGDAFELGLEADKAIAAREHLVSILPYNTETRLDLIGTLLVFGRIEAAYQASETLVEVRPAPLSTRLRLAELFRELGRLGIAMQHLREARKVYPEEPYVYLSMGLTQEARGVVEEAQHGFALAAHYSQGDTEILKIIASAYQRMGAPEQAAALLSHVSIATSHERPPQNELHAKVWTSQYPSIPTFFGDLSVYSTTQLYVAIYTQQMTGRLRVEREDEIIEIHWSGGMIVGALSDNMGRLSQELLDNGVTLGVEDKINLSVTQLRDLLRKNSPPEQYQVIIEKMTTELAEVVLLWSSGRFRFWQAQEIGSDLKEPISPLRLIKEFVERRVEIDEDGTPTRRPDMSSDIDTKEEAQDVRDVSPIQPKLQAGELEISNNS